MVVNVVTDAQASQAQIDHAVVDEVLILRAAQAQDEARRPADEGDFDGGQAALQSSADDLRSYAPMSAQGDALLAEADQLDEAIGLLSSAS